MRGTPGVGPTLDAATIVKATFANAMQNDTDTNTNTDTQAKSAGFAVCDS